MAAFASHFVERCAHACVHICIFIYYKCVHVSEQARKREKGEGWRQVKAELVKSVSLYCLLSPVRGTATCPNCKKDERIKKFEFGCDCYEKQSRMGMEGGEMGEGGLRLFIWSIFGSNAHTDSVKQEIEGNQTLVDWLVESSGFDFDPHSTVERNSKEEGEAERK